MAHLQLEEVAMLLQMPDLQLPEQLVVQEQEQAEQAVTVIKIKTVETAEPEVQQTLQAGQPAAVAAVAAVAHRITLQETVEQRALPEPAPEE
jgi:hypothetical protein